VLGPGPALSVVSVVSLVFREPGAPCCQSSIDQSQQHTLKSQIRRVLWI
jgi:hypothetical protein